MKYRATCTIIWDFESDLPKEQALLLARKHLDEIPAKDGMEDMRFVLNLDKLRSKVERIKLGESSLDEVFPFITEQSSKKEYVFGGDAYQVKMNVDRYHVFKANSKCVACGLRGTKMYLECHVADKTPHFNLYGEENGKLILFTKDHIKAKAFGGEDVLENYQTMCATCNSIKAHSNLSIENVKKLRDLIEEKRKVLTKKKLHMLVEEERMKLEDPWPHEAVKAVKPNEYCVRVLQNLVIYEENMELVGLPATETFELKKVMTVQKDSWLESVLEVNNFLYCKLTEHKIAKIHKNLVK